LKMNMMRDPDRWDHQTSIVLLTCFLLLVTFSTPGAYEWGRAKLDLDIIEQFPGAILQTSSMHQYQYTIQVEGYYKTIAPAQEIEEFYRRQFERQGWSLDKISQRDNPTSSMLKYRKGEKVMAVFCSEAEKNHDGQPFTYAIIISSTAK